jgi:hypothetical protein
MKKLAKRSKLQLHRETLHRLNELPEKNEKDVVGGFVCSKADTTCASCNTGCRTCITA